MNMHREDDSTADDVINTEEQIEQNNYGDTVNLIDVVSNRQALPINSDNDKGNNLDSVEKTNEKVRKKI